MAKKEKDNETPVVESDGGISVVKRLLKQFPDRHYNFEEDYYYQVSTGSLAWDVELGGGLNPGVHRFIGPPESGKSSAALEVCRNFLTEPHRKGFYVKAEGKLSRDMQARCGLKFVTDPDEWVDGTVFVLESNVYELVVEMISKLVDSKIPQEKKEEKRGVDTQFFFIIDSTDGMILANDRTKTYEEDRKVAGTPMLTKRFLQAMAIGMAKRGHICVLISQFSTNIQLNAYAAPEDKRPRSGGGGWGVAHFAHFIFEFLTPWNKDDILANPKEKPSKKNPRIGKHVNVKFSKSTNEKTGLEVSYPVKFGVIGGSSVWTALEVTDMMLTFGELRAKGSWLEFQPSLLTELEQHGLKGTLDGKTQLQGAAAVHEWLEANPTVTQFLYQKYRSNLTNAFQKTKDPTAG